MGDDERSVDAHDQAARGHERVAEVHVRTAELLDEHDQHDRARRYRAAADVDHAADRQAAEPE